MHIDKQILFKRIKSLCCFAEYSPCCISSIFYLFHSHFTKETPLHA